MPAERPSIFDLCPTCLNPKPCVLHDQRFMEELLHPEEQPPDIEKTKEWEYGHDILSICSMPDGSALVGGREGKIKRLDKNGTTLKDVGEYGNTIRSISLVVDFSAMKKSILVGGGDGKLHLWEVPEDKLRAYNERMSKIPEVPPMPEY